MLLVVPVQLVLLLELLPSPPLTSPRNDLKLNVVPELSERTIRMTGIPSPAVVPLHVRPAFVSCLSPDAATAGVPVMFGTS